jgi:5'-3' exoribonuclease 1
MGVPKFWRWLTERYPMINIDVDDHSLPEIDNLYLDLNGLVHMSTHSNSLSGLIPHLAPAPQIDEVWAKIFAYIETLLQMTKPRRFVYFAIDGVAPVAKCCQQRTRRYKHVHEVEEFEESERKEGRTVIEDWFDSSCISPGTDFMDGLTEQVDFFIKWKFANDPTWKKLEVVMSGGNVPGEGEHKILNYLRQCGSEANIRHCIYGLDADLILLGLTTHQPFMMVLREDVNITYVRSTPDRKMLGTPPNFKVLFLNLVREYMQVEVDTVPGLGLERYIDDFIFLSLFMGNDFLPRTPTFEIAEGALDFLISHYKQKWPTIGYLTDRGVINWSTLQGFMEGLMEFEDTIIRERIESKTSNRRQQAPMKPSRELSSLKSIFTKETVRIRTEGTANEDEEDKEREPRDNLATKDLKARLKSILGRGVEKVKDQYYLECLRVDVNSPEGPGVISELAREYLRGLQWVLCYYYRGCPDWEWFYPSHYCPMANELRAAIPDIQALAGGDMLPFESRGPLLALEQLLIVLPRKSKRLVPSEVGELYYEPSLVEYFPDTIHIEYDIMCAAVNWHSLKLMLPFPNVAKIKDKMQSVVLSPSSLRKNIGAQGVLLRYDASAPHIPVKSPNLKCKD